jgi:hypothetical protein
VRITYDISGWGLGFAKGKISFTFNIIEKYAKNFRNKIYVSSSLISIFFIVQSFVFVMLNSCMAVETIGFTFTLFNFVDNWVLHLYL